MYHVIHNIERVSSEVVSKALEGNVGAASVHEASGKLGAMSARIKPIYSGMRVCGPAYTVKLHPGDNLMLHGAIAKARPGDVLVVDIEGYEGGPLGEQMALTALSRGIAGMVIDGYVRDGLGIKEMGWPVFARGLSMRGTEKEVLGSINHPISCGDVPVNPGDLVLGDDDGVVVIPRELAADAVNDAIAREQKEAEGREAIRASGQTSWDVRFGKVAAEKGLTEEPD